MKNWPRLKKSSEFDESKVPYEYVQINFFVEYYIYKDDKDYTESFTKNFIEERNLTHIKNTNTACFAHLNQMITTFSTKNKEWPNRLLYKIKFKNRNLPEFRHTTKDINWWIETCKKHKFLPEYISKDFTNTGNFVLKIDKLNINTIYAYLTIARHLQDELYFIQAIKYLVMDKGIDFCTAFTIASRCCINSTSHHIINLGKMYPYTKERNSINCVKHHDLYKVAQLKRFLSNNSPESKDAIKNMKIGTQIPKFDLHITLAKIKVNPLILELKDLQSNKNKNIFNDFYKI